MNSYSLLGRAERFCQLNHLKKTAAIALGACAVSAQVQASGFQIMENSPVSQGMAMAGSGASPDDVTSIANNPAALGFVKKDQMYIGSSYLFANVKMDDAYAEHASDNNPMGLSEVTGDSSSGNVVGNSPIPALYGAWTIDDRIKAGFSLTVPWGMKTSYDHDSVVRYMAQDTEIESINLTPMMSYEVMPEVTVAAGFQIQYSKMKLSNYNGDPELVGGIPDRATNFTVDGWGTGFVIGMMAHPWENTFIGLSYRSQVKSTLKGDGAHYFFADGSGSGDTTPDQPHNGEADAKTDLDTPEVINLSITQRLTPDWDIRATAQFTRWSQYEKQFLDVTGGYDGADTTIVYDWHDTWYLALGTSYKLDSQWTLRTGIAWDQTPTRNTTRDARTPDADRTTVSFGASYQLDENFRVDMAYAHYFMDDTSINLDQVIGSAGPDIDPELQELNRVRANYSGSADVVALGVSYQF